MTRITKMEMMGFKSFEKKTLMLLPSNFSVICGPNGSGKSNVLDALCFVLGRTSAKSMRAGKMLEMIFNGSENRKPAEFAKVSIYLDNSKKEMPLDDENVCISRKVNRRGVSIYKLNGETVTREKMLEVLRSVHITPDGHNIILQGDVTEVIEMSPMGRREIIDEISGISEYDQKREKAQRELLIVEKRLEQAGIIINEREKSLEKLKGEAETAKKYNVYTKELDTLRASLASTRLKEAEGAMKVLNEKIEERKKDIGKHDKELEDIDNEISKTEGKSEEMVKKLFDRTSDIKVAKEVEKIRSEIVRKEDRKGSIKIDVGRMEGLIGRLKMIAESRQSSPVIKQITKLGLSGVYGTMADLSKVKKEYQTAVEVAAGHHLNDIVTSDHNVAIECVRFLKKNKIGRATFLPLNKIREKDGSRLKKFKDKPGVIGLAIDLIDFDKKYWHAFSNVFGDTLVVEDIETAKSLGIGAGRMVTLDGDLIERSGAIVGGFYKRGGHGKLGTEHEEIEKFEKQIKELKEESELIDTEIKKLNSQLKKVTEAEKESSEKVTEIQSERQKSEEMITKLRDKRRKFYDNKIRTESEINSLQIRRARLEAELDNIKAEFKNYSEKIKKVQMSLEQMENRIRELMHLIKELGPINQKATTEYEDQSVTYRELKERVEKLSEERDKVFQVMTDIESRRKETFYKTLTAVADQFSVVFKDLVKGEGTLRLDNPEDIESGLIIEASPPGKKVLNIDSMSGGEKTMTALAFLFAVQKFSPAPFYVLDEIDAALDKNNTKKITGLIKTYCGNAQFIVISHNDNTVSSADCVYGISMDKGVSKLVGIRMPN